MRPLITHTLPLSQVAEGYDIFEELGTMPSKLSSRPMPSLN